MPLPRQPSSYFPPLQTYVTRVGDTSSLFIEVGHGGSDYRPAAYSYRGAMRGYVPNAADRMSREAIRACRAGIRQEARRLGYRDVDFDSRAWAQPLRGGGFTVRFREVEFEGRRHDIEARISCTVRHGRIVDVDGIPRRTGAPRHDPYRGRR